jgi:hypothetical protein
MKLPRPHSKDVYHNTTIKEDLPWKLQQIQVGGQVIMTVFGAGAVPVPGLVTVIV